ncbi:VacJ family lipoprotein [Sandaracinobacter sp. RS1-74]|uniref:MlaA family lipoprotein n=1 Tax=Sandaracinobacteroides sayramensis TaxID=2913411 RepID=UPI001EDAFDED|nr:VacJ family lipoprotein [Sandaracinobacteroides sayramensis]MCG2840006.1 VacJ family lipoprotein [Sandaracinobacteroides sayramensis]
MPDARFLLPLALLALGACAHGGEKLDRVAITQRAVDDPWETTNRRIYSFSMKVDRNVLVPITEGYRTVVPEAPRRGISNFYNNAQEPTHLANAVLQGKGKSAFRALDRILVNGVLGLGVADHATDMGLPAEEHDFGQTMAVWGVPSGPYVFTPLLGPNTVRDGIGFLVDFIFDPADLVKTRLLSREERYIALGFRVLDTRSSLRDQGEQLLVGAADPYATARSAWLQLRRYQIFDGVLPDEPEDEFLDDLPPPPAEPAAEQSPGPDE